MSTFTLLIPGLFGPAHSSTPYPRVSALERILACATRSATAEFTGAENLVCRLFGITAQPDRDLPIAALTALIDLDQPQGLWIRADPVSLRPDLGKLLLFEIELTHTEAQALIAELCSRLEYPTAQMQPGRDPKRWYWRLSELPAIHTHPPLAALGQHIDPYILQGNDRREWQRRLNEIQMVLHGASVNQAREAQREPPINSLWFWGAGALPEVVQNPWDKLWGDEALAQGLAIWSGLAHAALPNTLADCLEALSGQNSLMVQFDLWRYAQAGDSYDWQTRLQELEQDWFAPLLQSLYKGHIKQLILLTERGDYRVSRAQLGQFWKRRQPLNHYA